MPDIRTARPAGSLASAWLSGFDLNERLHFTVIQGRRSRALGKAFFRPLRVQYPFVQIGSNPSLKEHRAPRRQRSACWKWKPHSWSGMPRGQSNQRSAQRGAMVRAALVTGRGGCRRGNGSYLKRKSRNMATEKQSLHLNSISAGRAPGLQPRGQGPCGAQVGVGPLCSRGS